MDVVGRDRELAAVRAALAERGAVVLVGPPGIGKTALARVVASVRVDLEAARTADEVRSALASAVGAPVERREAVVEAAAGLDALLLDGAEGCEETVADWLTDLVRRVPVVVTSRRRLTLPAPVLELGPLAVGDAVSLLRRKITSLRLAEALDDGDLAALAAALDGVPLALELAATRLRLHAADAVGRRTLDELRDPRRPARQDLAAAVRRSVAAVSEPARRTLAAAALLPSPFDVALLVEVAGEPVDDALLELLDAALVHPLGAAPPTFRVLHPIRAIALETLDDGARQELQGRLAVAVLARAEAAAAALDGPELAPPAGRLAPLRPVLERLVSEEAHGEGTSDAEIRLRAALVLATLERRTGPVGAILDRDARLPDAGPARLRVRWAMAVAQAACHLGRPDLAAAAHGRVAEVVPAELEAEWDSSRATEALAAGRLDDARALAEAACRAGDDPWLRFRLGAVHFRARAHEPAIAAFEAARAVPSAFRRAQATYALCAAMRDAGRPRPLILAELDAVEGVDDLRAATWLVPRLAAARGVLLADLGQIAAARRHLRRASALLQALGEGADAFAQWLLAAALELVEGGIPEGLLTVVAPASERPAHDAWRAVVHAALGQPEAAAAIGTTATAALRERGDPRADELTATVAVALAPTHPELARDLVGALPEGSWRELADRCVAGEVPEPEPVAEQRLLVAVAALPRRRIRVAADGSAFVGPDGVRVDIGGRRVLKRVLAALAESEAPLDVPAICARVWPGERLVGESGTRRVHVAISTLRGLGLRDAIVTVAGEDGETAWQLLAARDG